MNPTDAYARLQDICNVSRETFAELQIFSDELVKWNSRINLVSPGSLPDLWQRHIIDSAQLLPRIDVGTRTLLDIGTGGGFPGLIIAILAKEMRQDLIVTMIESDQRKCAFLRTISNKLNLRSNVFSDRIENVEPMKADVLTSRALASVAQLLTYADRHLTSNGKALFLKGAKAQSEVDEALATWDFDLQKVDSQTSADAAILEIANLRPR